MPNDYQVFWGKYPNFEKVEFDCRETGENNMRPEFMNVLQKIRDVYGKAMVVASGYRSPLHSREAIKPIPGEHTLGLAADIRCSGEGALNLVDCALACGIRRIGIHQKGNNGDRFIHIGFADHLFKGYPSSIWTY